MGEGLRRAFNMANGLRWTLINTSTGEVLGNYFTPEALAARLKRSHVTSLEVLKTKHGETVFQKTAQKWLTSIENPDRRTGHIGTDETRN
jgi:hypothetical protein